MQLQNGLLFRKNLKIVKLKSCVGLDGALGSFFKSQMELIVLKTHLLIFSGEIKNIAVGRSKLSKRKATDALNSALNSSF